VSANEEDVMTDNNAAPEGDEVATAEVAEVATETPEASTEAVTAEVATETPEVSAEAVTAEGATETPEASAEAVTAEAATETPEASAEAVVATPAAPASTGPAPASPSSTGPSSTGPATRSRGSKAAKSSHLAQTVGRRKEAIVRVRIITGTGSFTLNGRTLESYFPNKVHQQLVREPLVITEKAEAFDIVANLRGGGVTGQAGALRLAVARALAEVNPDDRPALKKAGFLTRDARVTESKKYGLKKARKAPQYSKR
jgi:small subunit ribosomal protein S9